MKKYLIHLFSFFFLLFLAGYPLEYYLSKNYYTTSKQSWVLNQKGGSYDFAVLGSSRVYNMVDINTMEKELGGDGINIATSGSNYAENYLILMKFVENNNLSTLILNIDQYSLDSKNSFSYPFHEFEFIPFFGEGNCRSTFLDNLSRKRYYLWRLYPLAGYIEFNDVFYLKQQQTSEWDLNKGTQLLEKKREGPIKKKHLPRSIDALDKKYFYKIVEFCEQESIEVLLVTTPIYEKERSTSDETYQHIVDAINCNYISYKEIFEFDNSNYFEDQTHTSQNGSIIYSKALAKSIKDRMNN